VHNDAAFGSYLGERARLVSVDEMEQASRNWLGVARGVDGNAHGRQEEVEAEVNAEALQERGGVGWLQIEIDITCI
jgi:hypothetical protein